MTIDDCKSIVGEYALPIAQVLGLGGWCLSFSYDDDGENYGTAQIAPDQQWAGINIDPDMHSNKAEVLDTILHELLHVVHAPLEQFRHQVNEHTKGAAREIFVTLGTTASEQLVAAWLGILTQVLGLTPAKLARKAQ